MRIVASAIVRNEASRYLPVWLAHLRTFCDEVRLLDDGSEDATVPVAAMFPNVWVDRNDGPSFFEDESAARNRLLEWTYEAEPELVLSIDADEFIGDPVALRSFVEMNPAPAYQLTMREVWKLDERRGLGLRYDGLWGDRRCPILWRAPHPVVSARGGHRWRVPPRRLACGREPFAVRRSGKLDSKIGVYHFGWTRVADREARAQRYFDHDQGRFHADRHLQSILWPDSRVKIRWLKWPSGIPQAVAECAA